MKRLVLILGLAVAAWLGRRELRSAADAQRYLTLLALLQIIACLGKTSASPKAVSVENRLNTVVLPKLGSLSTTVTTLAPLASNASLLASLSQQLSPSGFGGAASNSNADLFNWSNNATARFNQIYTLMQNTNLWT